MEIITHHSINRASEEAIRLWALASAQYPRQHELLLDVVAATIIESVSAFALNARRALEILPKDEKFVLNQARWVWKPTSNDDTVLDLWDALNRIIHAQELKVGFEELPTTLSVIEGGSLVVPYVKARTDRKALAFIDIFALAHAYLYGAFPRLVEVEQKQRVTS